MLPTSLAPGPSPSPLRRSATALLRLGSGARRLLLLLDLFGVPPTDDQPRARLLGRRDQISPLSAIEIASLFQFRLDGILPPTRRRRLRRRIRNHRRPRNPERNRINLGPHPHHIFKYLGPA